MNSSGWDEKMQAFLSKARQDVRRVAQDVRQEAERLVSEVQDPRNQEKIRTQLRSIGDWARSAAEEVAGLVEQGVRKAEQAFAGREGGPTPPPTGPVGAPPTSSPDRPAVKSVGGRRKARSGGKGATPKKKTIGKKTPPVT